MNSTKHDPQINIITLVDSPTYSAISVSRYYFIRLFQALHVSMNINSQSRHK